MTKLNFTEFGNPILREKTKNLSLIEIKSETTQSLIKNMYSILREKKLGVGLAANQVGINNSIAVIDIQKTKLRKKVDPFSLTIINPKITKTFGYRKQMWEGCISSGKGKAGLFAKVPRYKKIELEFMDEKGAKHKKLFEGLPAHVIQHEVDHLNGVLFVDNVKDTKTYMTYNEYKKMKKNEAKLS